jgi:hypothetical protein
VIERSGAGGAGNTEAIDQCLVVRREIKEAEAVGALVAVDIE